MKVLVSLEIKFKTNKNKRIDLLKHFGFNRLQENLYFGDIKYADFYAMEIYIMENIREYDSVLTIPLCKNCYEKLNVFGRNLSFTEELYKIF